MKYNLDRSAHGVYSLQYHLHCYGGDSFWSNSYFITSTGQVSLDVLKAYVESQGEKIADANQ